jgi:hypothetical protein
MPRELQGARTAVLRDPRLRAPPGGARRYQDLTERQGTFNSVSSSVAANPRDCRPRLASPSAGRSPRQARSPGGKSCPKAVAILAASARPRRTTRLGDPLLRRFDLKAMSHVAGVCSPFMLTTPIIGFAIARHRAPSPA